ncbi:EOGT [Bugula neritina]|uniref:EGF domain-specific O-linked N-acetylglucosamine transferase n=1 Tax=Bugula neritina TaxID=10212 RepID=A0A7J7JAD6_BUGNE|nr:EOGT [Bugula neritina]
MLLSLPLFLIIISTSVTAIDWSDINLHQSHVPLYLQSHADLKIECSVDPECPFKDSLESSSCFGYEESCKGNELYKSANCPDLSKWAKSADDQKRTFWNTGDFGIVSEKRKNMEVLCSSSLEDGSYMECEAEARYCHGTNIVLDLEKVTPSKPYDTEFIKAGQIGGRCKVNKKVIKGWNRDHRNFLQSWYQVVEHFTELPEEADDQCDVVFSKPVYILQNDAVVNMFHHFCDFVNLYVTQHLNSTTFSLDNHIIAWQTNGGGFSDPFGAMWKVFTKHPVTAIGSYVGKKVCFKDVVFALPPRQRLGLFYNMPLIDGCYGTSLFRAFNEHIMHRLAIQQAGPLRDKVRITILSRQSQYRNILNEQELVDALNRNPRYEAKIAVYKFASRTEDREENFLRQIETTHNSDIFIGMHGAGLTHMLFLPHWAAVMELYHCEDRNCYSTLARLRGVKYFTWTNMKKLYPEDEGHHPTLGAHEKFTNYNFDVGEFLRIVKLAADHVMKHKEFRMAKRKIYKPETVREEL